MHVTDATNASRTSLYNIHENCWDDELLSLFKVPRAGLPKVMDCAAEFRFMYGKLVRHETSNPRGGWRPAGSRHWTRDASPPAR